MTTKCLWFGNDKKYGAVHGEQQDEQSLSVVGGGDESGGCLGCLACLVSLIFLVGLVLSLSWLVFE